MLSESNPFSPSRVPFETACKCCGATSCLVGVVDASRSGSDVRAGRVVTELSGLAVFYHRCVRCGFTFTRAFDHWTPADFAEHIYNHEYGLHDPEYCDGQRGRRTAMDIINQFGLKISHLSVLDWGAGKGGFTATLKSHGFKYVDSYDPFESDACELPDGKYNVVTCFEVIEHVLNPVELICDLAARRTHDGAILISTLCCTQSVVEYGLENWHYCVPRNGHISLMTPMALQACAREVNLSAHSFNEGAHVIFDSEYAPKWLSPMLPLTVPAH